MALVIPLQNSNILDWTLRDLNNRSASFLKNQQSLPGRSWLFNNGNWTLIGNFSTFFLKWRRAISSAFMNMIKIRIMYQVATYCTKEKDSKVFINNNQHKYMYKGHYMPLFKCGKWVYSSLNYLNKDKATTNESMMDRKCLPDAWLKHWNLM